MHGIINDTGPGGFVCVRVDPAVSLLCCAGGWHTRDLFMGTDARNDGASALVRYKTRTQTTDSGSNMFLKCRNKDRACYRVNMVIL